MLGKLIKHDLNYSKKAFLSIAAVAIVFSLVVTFSVSFGNTLISIILLSITGIIMSVMFIISIILIYNSYKKSLFGQNGYLFLTIPVSKNKLLLSKIIGALIWLNFMSVVTIIMTVIIFYVSIHLDGNATMRLSMSNWFEVIGQLLYMALFINVFKFATIIVLFMTITLANASFASKRLHWVFAVVIGLVYYVLYIRGAALIGPLFFDATSYQTSMFELTLLKLYSLVVGCISYFITLQLLRKRIELE